MKEEPMDSNDFRLKVGLAEMLKGGVIMDVVNADQAKIAEDAGAVAVMALERVPADIRKEGGVARMSPVSKVREIQKAVSIPVMAKCRIGHLGEARILEALKVDFIDESEVRRPPTRKTTSTSTISESRSSAAAVTSARRCAGSAKAPR
jgi:pyridoxal 5'-phosphate synthase pdxS subunit